RREQGPPLPQELDGLDDPEAAGAGGPPPARTIAVAPAAPMLDVAPVPAELGDDGDAPEEDALP
ncbi:MAG: thioredoxin, partial [Myxococcales bacterium]|nr:thioredoxin [Myxococcales bacterium]